MSTAVIVSVLLESTLITPEQADQVVHVLQRQLDEHFTPIWSWTAELQLVLPIGTPADDSWWLRIVDDDQQAQALGVHELNPQGLPQGIVYVQKDNRTLAEWSITASHELLEMLADPHVNLCVRAVEKSRLYAYEVCDPCDNDHGPYTIDNVMVANFVYPAWFQEEALGQQLDYQQQTHTSLVPAPGGYISICDTGSNGWMQIGADGHTLPTHLALGSRRLRRTVHRHLWQRSQPRPPAPARPDTVA